MHYYQFNIGDYRRDTQHLTPLEHGIYRLLLDQYYLTEKPIDANALRLLCIRNANEVAIALRMLEEFFNECEHGKFEHKRALSEIEKFHGKSEKASKSAKLRWDANAMRTQCEGNANQEPRTKNQEPLTKNHTKEKARTIALACPPEIDPQIWDDWLSLRKAKRAPVTETVLNAAKTEAEKAGMTLEAFLQEWVSRGSQGLKAEWIKPQGRNPAPSKLDGYLSNFKDKGRENERDITSTAVRVD